MQTYLGSLGYFEYPSSSDLEKELHKPFNLFCKNLLSKRFLDI
jgi:hypothetical protein